MNAAKEGSSDGIACTSIPLTYADKGELKLFSRLRVALITAAILLTQGTWAATLYVNVNNAGAAPPYLTWDTAATNIQDAVDVAARGDDILVTNGVYQSGVRSLDGLNRVAVTNGITIRSVNGPAETIIKGYQVPGTTNGAGSVRCVYLANGAVLVGFTLTNGAAQGVGGGALGGTLTNCTLSGNSARQGGGAWLSKLINCVLSGNSAVMWGGGADSSALTNCTLSGNSAGYAGGAGAYTTLANCVVSQNSASSYGGGAFVSAIYNSMLSGNKAAYGGGACGDEVNGYSTLNNCTLTGNVALRDGGGAFGAYLYNCALDRNRAGRGGGVSGWQPYFPSVLNNCTLTGNSAGVGGGASDSIVKNCIIYYNDAAYGSNYYNSTLGYSCSTPVAPGTGNLADEPQLASLSHLSAGSPCRDKGSAEFTTGVDVDGEPWANPPCIGCDQYSSGSVTGSLNVVVGGGCTGLKVELYAAIEGRVTASYWEFEDGTVVSNRPSISREYSAPGAYPVALRAYNESYPTGVVGTFVANLPVVHYVALNSTNPAPPYTNWATAALDINLAIEVSGPGALVFVADGIYKTGGRSVYETSNRVAITKTVTVRSVNGPAATHIVGAGPVGSNAVRCVYLTNGAALVGFTLTNGATLARGQNTIDYTGGGAWCETNAVLSNCVITDNSSAGSGGGVYHGTLDACVVKNNSAVYEGAGAVQAVLKNCLIRGNSLTGTNLGTQGGGVASCSLVNCVLTDNFAPHGGGGAAWSGLANCVVAGNSLGGTHGCTAMNTIIYYNSPPETYANLQYFRHCCLTPLSPGPGNFTNAPLFVDTNGWSNLRLQTNSPCINAGNNSYLTNTYGSGFTNSLDLDGNARIAGGTTDVGAYEFQWPASMLSYAWLQQYGLATDGSADTTDNDLDGFNNWQEWIADTIPTDTSSALRLLSLSNSLAGPLVTWSSVRSRTYTLERATSIQTPLEFGPVGVNLEGSVGVTTFTDTNAPGRGPFFYRVRIAGPSFWY